ncbi:MAG: InlB B-repeat-containing protein [Clostridia bacterium]|nr:InlB B-repeat-containing protein [Clostridia bacterium]
MKSSISKIISLALVLIFVFSICSCTPDFVEELGDIDDESTTATITYDTQGGKMPSGIKNIKSYSLNKVISTSPKPTKEGYTFVGWFLDEEKVSFPYRLTKSVTLVAKWEEIIERSAVSLKLNGGALPNGEETITKYDSGSKITSIPTPVKDGFDFLGWFIAGEEVQLPYAVTCDVIFVAKWEQILTDSDINTDTDIEKEKVTITLDLSGGALTDGAEASSLYEVGSTITSLPTPSYEGYEFIGWHIDGEPITLPYEVAEEKTITAVWQQINKITVSLDADGGELPEGSSDSFEAIVGKPIGALPTPTKLGYDFLGWFEDGDSDKEIDKKTIAGENDLSLVALWEPLGELVTVEFSLLADEALSIDLTYFEMVKGDRISDYLFKLPTASREGYRFTGWQTQAGITVTSTSIITEDTVLTPVWEKIYLCYDGTENHQWTIWQESEPADCINPQALSRTCTVCGYQEFNIITEALGHNFGAWETKISENGNMIREHYCSRCTESESEPLKNITFSSFNTPSISGECYGSDNAGSLIDGDFTDTNISGKGTGAVTVTLSAKTATYVDIFTVTGYGTASYTISVTYSNGTQKSIGIGSFGSTRSFAIEANIVQITILMENPSVGSDFWSELAAYVINK